MMPMVWIVLSGLGIAWSAYFWGELGFAVAFSVALLAMFPMYYIDTRYL